MCLGTAIIRILVRVLKSAGTVSPNSHGFPSTGLRAQVVSMCQVSWMPKGVFVDLFRRGLNDYSY